MQVYEKQHVTCDFVRERKPAGEAVEGARPGRGSGSGKGDWAGARESAEDIWDFCLHDLSVAEAAI